MDSPLPRSASPANPLSVVVVGGSTLTRMGILALLAEAKDLRVEYQLARLDSAPPRIAALPDVVLMDYEGSDQLPPAAMKALRERWPAVPAIVLVAAADTMHAGAWIRAGARGVIGREQVAAFAAKAVRAVARGELWVDRLTTSRLVEELAAENRRLPQQESDPRAHLLSPRERKVVELLAKGMSNKAIARALDITENTVRHHLSSVFAKLRVHDRLGLALYAHRYLSGPSRP